MVTIKKPSGPSLAALTKFEELFAKQFPTAQLRRTNVIEKYEVIPTGSIALDCALGVGGYVEGRLIEDWGPDGSGKGHPVDHPVLTPDGWRRIGDLEEGDLVIGSDGLPIAVTGIYDRGELNINRVTFNDGAEVLCDDDHLWTVQASKGWVSYDTRTLRDEKSLKTPEGWNRYRIPLVQPVEHPTLDLPINPYLLGALLANGHLVGTPVIRTNDEHVRARVLALDEVIKEATSEKSTAKGLCINGIRDRLRVLGLYGHRSATKFIPEMYLRSGVRQRQDLLYSLLDCDGSSGRRTTYHTTSRRLAEGVVELVRSLGGIARIHHADREHPDGRPYTEYSVAILIANNPFSTPKKAAIWKTPTKLSRRMSSIEPAGRAEVRCIRVAAGDHLYVTKDHVVTHNTSRALIACAQAQKKHPGKMAAFIDMEAKLDLDWAVKLGVDLERMYHVKPDSAEELADIVKAMVQSNLVSILVIDSIGAMVNEEEQEKDANQRSVGTTPGIITRMVKIAASEAKKNGTVVYLINQVRANLGYGADTTAGGGFARAHATTHRLKSRTDGGQPFLMMGSGNSQVQVGVKLALKVEKNGVAPPKRTASVILITSPTEKYGMKIGFADQAAEAMGVGKLYGVIPRSGSMYTLPDGEVVKGADAAEARLREKPELIAEVRRLALESIASTVVQTELEEG